MSDHEQEQDHSARANYFEQASARLNTCIFHGPLRFFFEKKFFDQGYTFHLLLRSIHLGLMVNLLTHLLLLFTQPLCINNLSSSHKCPSHLSFFFLFYYKIALLILSRNEPLIAPQAPTLLEPNIHPNNHNLSENPTIPNSASFINPTNSNSTAISNVLVTDKFANLSISTNPLQSSVPLESIPLSPELYLYQIG
jgi:hypothetical protein